MSMAIRASITPTGVFSLNGIDCDYEKIPHDNKYRVDFGTAKDRNKKEEYETLFRAFVESGEWRCFGSFNNLLDAVVEFYEKEGLKFGDYWGMRQNQKKLSRIEEVIAAQC